MVGFRQSLPGPAAPLCAGQAPQRTDAEDVVQETFVAFLRSIARYRGECDLETYLFALMRRKIIDSYRSAGARRVCLIQDAGEMTPRTPPPTFWM